MSALTSCFYCHTPVNFLNSQAMSRDAHFNAVEGDAQCTKCGAVYRLTIVQLRTPERVDVPLNVSDHDREIVASELPTRQRCQALHPDTKQQCGQPLGHQFRHSNGLTVLPWE